MFSMLKIVEFSGIAILIMLLLSYIQCYNIYLKYKHLFKCMQSLISIRCDGAENDAIRVCILRWHGNHTYSMTFWMELDDIGSIFGI